jgi:hypothetical protein
MKSTNERLAESYCSPIKKEWDAFGLIPLSGHCVAWLGCEPTLVSGKFANRTEIPVSHFTDLIYDRIAPWRLEEDGFTTAAHSAGDYKFNTLMGDVIISWDSLGDAMLITMDTDEPLDNITTYTDLLTLIRLIG